MKQQNCRENRQVTNEECRSLVDETWRHEAVYDQKLGLYTASAVFAVFAVLASLDLEGRIHATYRS